MFAVLQIRLEYDAYQRSVSHVTAIICFHTRIQSRKPLSASAINTREKFVNAAGAEVTDAGNFCFSDVVYDEVNSTRKFCYSFPRYKMHLLTMRTACDLCKTVPERIQQLKCSVSFLNISMIVLLPWIIQIIRAVAWIGLPISHI